MILIRDCTLREGLEVPGVNINLTQKLKIVEAVIKIGVSELEIISPGNFLDGLQMLKSINKNFKIKTSAIVPLLANDWKERIQKLSDAGIGQVDLLIHISDIRLRSMNIATDIKEYILSMFSKPIEYCRSIAQGCIGIGLGDATRANKKFLQNLVKTLSFSSVNRFVLYDTVGVALPFNVSELVMNLKKITASPLHFHFHNDLGLATANSISAIQSGAYGVDVTVNGYGDRCGNASLEEVVTILELFMGLSTNIDLKGLSDLCQLVQDVFNLRSNPLKPIVGEFAFAHSTQSHFPSLLKGNMDSYEPYEPEKVGQSRKFELNKSKEFIDGVKELLAINGLNLSKNEIKETIENTLKRSGNKLFKDTDIKELFNGRC